MSFSITQCLLKLFFLFTSLEAQVLFGPLTCMIVALIGYYANHLDGPMCLVLGLCGWMIVWWLSEVFKMGITSLLPIALFPLFGIIPGNEVSSLYFSDGVIVCWGSMLMVIAIEKYNLHKRLAYFFLSKVSAENYSGLLAVFIASTSMYFI